MTNTCVCVCVCACVDCHDAELWYSWGAGGDHRQRDRCRTRLPFVRPGLLRSQQHCPYLRSAVRLRAASSNIAHDALSLNTQAAARRSLLSRCHMASRNLRKCNFLSPQLPLPPHIPSTEFYPNWKNNRRGKLDTNPVTPHSMPIFMKLLNGTTPDSPAPEFTQSGH